jgi:Tol biopolymer transport system component
MRVCRRRGVTLALTLGALLAASVSSASAGAGLPATLRVTVSTNGIQAERVPGVFAGNHFSITADGRFVAFESVATNLVPGDTNGASDVFVREVATGVTTLVSRAYNGTQGNSDSLAPSISANGRFVVFESSATNLVPGDTNQATDIFMRDRWTGQTTRMSVSASGAEAQERSFGGLISGDGRVVVFVSAARNLVPDDTNFVQDIFVRDRLAGTTTRASVPSHVGQSDNDSFQPSISGDGRFVAFASIAANLVPGDTNGITDVFVHDRRNRTTERASLTSTGAQAQTFGSEPEISADGRFVAFQANTGGLVPGDTNGKADVYVRDRRKKTTTRVSLSSTGAQGDDASTISSISANGRFVVFESVATNLVPGDTNGVSDVFLRDRWAHKTRRVSISAGGAQGNRPSFILPSSGAVSADGRRVAFASHATNLVPGDTNGARDVFVRQVRVGRIPDDDDRMAGLAP